MMSIITEQPTEFQDQPTTHSSVSIHNSPLVQEELEKNILDNSNYTPCTNYHKDKSICQSYNKDKSICESLHKDKSICASYHKDNNIFESYYKDESICERYLKDKNICSSYHKDKNILESNHKDKSVYDSHHKDEKIYGGSHQKNENVHELTRTSNTNENLQVPAQDKLSSLPSIKHISYLSHPKTENDNHPKPASVKNGTSLHMSDNQPKPASGNTKENQLPPKQEKDASLISKHFSDTETQNNPNPWPSFGEVPNSIDDASKKQFNTVSGKTDALNDNELLKTDESSLNPSDCTSIISSQREKILKIRREERLSEERINESKSKTMPKNRDRENISYENFVEGKKKQNISTEMKSASKGEKSKHKKKKRIVDYGGFNDIFSEPLNVKQFYSDGSKKRERKIPSKFIYLSKMEKYLSHSPKSKHKKKYKSKSKLSEDLTDKVKVEKDTNRETANETEERKDISKIKMCTMKVENTGVLKQQTSVKKQNRGKDSHLSSSGNTTSSKSSISSVSLKSLKKSQQLRDDDFHQHCLRRHYRLKSSNWNCSSRSALRQLKRKYNSIRLLFDSEPIVYLKKLKLRDINLKKEIDICAEVTESKNDCIKEKEPGSNAVKSGIETISEGIESMRPTQNMMKVSIKTEPDTKVNNPDFTVRQKEIQTETENLVDPRVMSLSKTLQSANNGKIGLEKIFKNCNSKPVKSKRKENSKSHGQSVKRKVKPDWSKWKEKLKEASNRMVERKKGGLVIEKNINRFPNTYANIGPPSILHFRIPLKSNNKDKIEGNNSPDVKGIENALNTQDAETVQANAPESECLEVNKNELSNTKDEDESKLLKEINEELTLEEFETDSFITYSINGYSIEISRDSPIDAKMNEDEKSAKNECFDEDEMNKILYGDNLDDVTLDCHTRNEEHLNETDTGLTVTSDIIPNLCAQDENIFRDIGDFTDEIDKSPPVLEKLSISAENSNTESENFYIVHENEEQRGSMSVEETEEQTVTDYIRIDSVHSDSTKTKTEISAKGELMTTNANVDAEVEISCKCKDRDDLSHVEAAIKTLPSSKFNNSDIVDEEDNQNFSDINGDESYDPSPFLIENVCSLNEIHHMSEHCQEQEKYWSTTKADNKMDESIIESEMNYSSSKGDGEIDKSEKDFEGSFEYEDLNKQDNMEMENAESLHPLEEFTRSMMQANEGEAHCTDATESISESEIDTCIIDKGSLDIKCSEVNFKLQGSCNNSININKKNELPHTNKSENLFEKNEDTFDKSESNVVGRNETSAFSDIRESKSHEKSAAAVIEDLEKLWEEMKTNSDEVENVSLKSVCVVDRGDKSEKENYINGKLSSDSAEMELCDDAEQSMFETFKDISDPQRDENELVKDKEKNEVTNIEKKLDCGISMKVMEVTETEGYDKANAESDINVQTTTKPSTLTENNSIKKSDQNILSKPTDYDYENNDEQYFSSEATDNTEESDISEDGESEDESEMKEVVEICTAETLYEGANEEMENRETEAGKQKKRKRKVSKDNFSGCENTHSSDDNMEQNEERIMCDFPNHNWLFNKYNISEVRTEKEIVKDVKGKKQKKDDKDTVKQSAEVNSRRKSSNSTANILPTQRKQSTCKSDFYPKTRDLQKADKHKTGNISPEHKSIKIKWNKIKKQNSTGDSVNMGEKMDIMAEKDGDMPFDKNKLNTKYFDKFGNDALDQTNLQEKTGKVEKYSLSKKNEYNKNTFMFSNHEDTCETAAKVLKNTKDGDLNIDFHKNTKGEISLNSNTADDIYLKREQKCKISADISSSKLKDSVFLDKIRTEKRETGAVSLKDPKDLEKLLFGDISDDNDDDDDDEEKLEIDESACTEDTSSDEKLFVLDLQNTESDEQISKLEQSTKKSVVVTTPESVNLTDTDAVEEKCDLGPIAGPSTTSSSLDSIPDKGVTAEVTTLKSDVKTADTVTAKNTVTNRFEAGVLDLCAVKSEAGSISFRPRAKPPVQLVHPQVHKPPTGKIKVESVATPEITTHVSLHTENKEESVAIITNVDSCPDQTAAGSVTRPGSTSAQIRSAVDITVNSSVSSQLSTALVNSGTNHVPVTVLPTLAQIPTGCITVTSTASTNFGNGMVIPIQPFVQNVPSTLQQGYVQSMPQLQPSIVQIQSQNIDPLFQQPSPVHIQNQLIPVTIYQAGNQTLISNYTYTNSGSEHGVSSQSANVIQAQPVNFNMNQTLNTSSVRMPLCRPVNTGPPPLLILPKPSNLSSSLNQQSSQSPKKENSSFKSQKQKNTSPKDKVNSSERNQCKTIKQKAKQISSKRDSGDSVSESKVIPSDSDKEKDHSEGSGNVEEVDDEITKQMEELDREIKQKEQEQEEMRRKKLELLEKMKQAKSINKKDTEPEMDCNDKREIDKCDKEKTDQDRKEISQSAESVSKVVETGMQKTLTDKEKVHKKKNRSCKDMVLSEIAEKTNDDVFDSDTPIDLSSALKCSQVNSFSGNLSLTVSNGIISIKEHNNNIESSMVHSDGNLETEKEGGECEFDCMEDDDSVLRDNYQTGKCDGINYIEDIGLVNPFTGEYEINEDVEGVEYLDLSTKPDERSNDKDSETVEESDHGKDIEIVESECRNQDKSADCNKKMQTDEQEASERRGEESAEETTLNSSEKSATKMLPVTASITKPVSAVTDTIKQSSVHSLSSSMTPVSVLSSSAPTMSCSVKQLSSVSKSGYSKSADVSSAVTDESLHSGKPCDIDVSVSEEHYVNNSCDVEDAPLNLEKPKSTTSLVKSGYSSIFTSARTDKNTQNTQIDTRTQSVTQSENNLTPAIKECEVMNLKIDTTAQNYTKFPRTEMNLGNAQESQIRATDSQMPSLPADTLVPQIQLSSQSSTVRSRPSRIQKVMLQQDKQVLGPVSTVNDNRQIVGKQNPRMNSDNRHSRGLYQRRIREKYMELKPAHYKSPPRKIHKGEKPMQAHNQKPTSREAMKKMCRTPFIHPHVVYKTSPYVCRKHPLFLSPKEVEKPFPRLWEKRPPKPAHSKRPFGIAGHLIVQSSRKYRKRIVSGDIATSPRFYSLPNTPTSTNATPPRATSADYHSTYSPLQSPTEVQEPSNSVPTTTSPNKTGDHHGAQVGLPSPIRAHCRPKSMISCSQFYETSVLRPPALLRNFKPPAETSGNDVIEIIDLTADVPPPSRSDSAAKSAESPKSKEKAIQKELSHAVSKRQKLDNVEASPNERANYSSQNAAMRQQQLLSEIVARQRLMPPPPYTGRQRMPVLVQVPRRPTLEPQQRMAYNRRMDSPLDESRRLIAQNMVQPDMQRFQKPPDRMQVNEPQIRPQMWSSQYVGPTQDTRAYGVRAPQAGVHTQDLSPGNEQLIQNQDVGPMRGAPQQMMYPPRGPIQSAGMTGYVGNARMQYPSNVPVNSVPQQGYTIRGQNIPYTTTQNPTQIHQLLQQQRASSQMMPRGDPSTQMMQRGDMNPQMMQRGEISHQMIHRGETSPQMLHRGELSPQIMQRGDISPQMMQRGEVSPQMMHRGEISPQIMQRGETSPQMMQRGEVSPQMIQRGVTSPQMIMNGSLSPLGMQRGMSTQMIPNVSTGMPVMQAPNVQMMPTGEIINQKVMYSAGNGSQMMNPGNTSPQIHPTGMLAQAQAQAQAQIQNASAVNGYQRPQIQSDNQMQGQSSTLTPEQRFQRMQQIRAQHIRSQQLHNRGAQAGFEQGVRMPDTRTQHVGIDPNSAIVNASTVQQQMAAYNTALPHQSTGPKGSQLQTSTYPQQMAVLEPQMERGIHPHHQGQQMLESGNKGLPPPPYPVASSQTQPATIHQPAHFHQTGVQNNINTMQQNNFVPRPTVYIPNQNIQVPQSKPVPSVMNNSQHAQNIQGQGHTMTQMPSCMVSVSQGRQVQGQDQYSSQIQANGTVVPGGQMTQGQNISNISDSARNYHQNKVGQFQNPNWRVQSSEQQAINVTKKGQMVVTKPNAVQQYAVSSVNRDKNVLLGDGSGQQNISKAKDLTIAIVTETQLANVIPHSQPTVAMTASQIITQNATPQDVATNHSEVNNTQVSPSMPQGQSEGQGETKVMEEEELPHLQQVHGECVMCGKYSLYLCSNCKKIWYCSPECQLTHWQTHANECEGQTD